MANIQGIRRKASEMALVLTENQFHGITASAPSLLDNNYVYLSSVQMRNELCGGVIKGALPEGSVALFPQKCSAGYLSFLLNSLPCKLALFGNKLNVKAKTKISRKAVGELIVFEVEKDSDEAYAIADQLRTLAFEQYNKDRSNAAFHHFYMIWDDFCNILAIELYAHPLFEKNDIHILENWKDVLQRFSKDNDLNVLFGFLTKSDEKLRNEIIKAHMLADNVDKYIKELNDGLED